MLCSECNKNPAILYYKKIENKFNITKEYRKNIHKNYKKCTKIYGLKMNKMRR